MLPALIMALTGLAFVTSLPRGGTKIEASRVP